ncbi:MAG: response regulator [Hydrogenophaga sp.]|uniref:response regulator n=1 Tax=Hydrogenophaga sp. TaxID=1904254 RepID=UPI001696B91A|nr:response regulator [Hydrogenophaga sp.]NIM40510.1 response regulator [Hydrogenophaga sp.]NIN25928.1 response regulator [Hydrogenophaga sp.]NIN30800.1 response regulator [Hydrogenophaga sp.]NIN54893.1 response regulator [Hydrogenophaga sp.]NIO50933.1 response regulator [Hydrogenophaga sp.]
MALTLSLFQRPGGVLFLDDDPDYLDMLGMVVPAQTQVELYARPSAFLTRMQSEPAHWEADAALQLQMVDRWRQGQALIPQVLRYWASRPERYHLAQVCVVDYAMPGTDGLTVLNTLLDWPGARVLLTGQADEQIAIQAFNNGLIDQFVPKQATDITRHLLGVLRRLAQAPHPRLNTLWRGVLRPNQLSLLQIPSVAQWLRDYTHHHWVEYVVIGEPFGLIGLDMAGQVHWLQLEPTSSLPDLADLAASAALGMDVVQSIRSGQRLAAVELHQQLALPGKVRTAPAIAIGEDGLLMAAPFQLESSELQQPIYPYRNFLQAENHRTVQDG